MTAVVASGRQSGPALAHPHTCKSDPPSASFDPLQQQVGDQTILALIALLQQVTTQLQSMMRVPQTGSHAAIRGDLACNGVGADDMVSRRRQRGNTCAAASSLPPDEGSAPAQPGLRQNDQDSMLAIDAADPRLAAPTQRLARMIAYTARSRVPSPVLVKRWQAQPKMQRWWSPRKPRPTFQPTTWRRVARRQGRTR